MRKGNFLKNYMTAIHWMKKLTGGLKTTTWN